jgi:hypothetical protein
MDHHPPNAAFLPPQQRQVPSACFPRRWPRRATRLQSEGVWPADSGRPVYGIEAETTVVSGEDGPDGSRLEIVAEEIEATGMDIVVSRDAKKRDFQPIDRTPHEPILLFGAALGVVAGAAQQRQCHLSGLHH